MEGERIRVSVTQWARIKACEECGETFTALRSRARFCGDPCQYRAWAREHRPRGQPRTPRAQAEPTPRGRRR